MSIEAKVYYRVEKWIVRDLNGVEDVQFRRQRNFDTLEEAQEYIDNASSIYRLKLYKVLDSLLQEREPAPREPMTPEELAEYEKMIAELLS